MKQTALPCHELAALSYSMMGRQAPQSLGTSPNSVPKIYCQNTFENFNKNSDVLHIFFLNIMKLRLLEMSLIFRLFYKVGAKQIQHYALPN